MFINCLRSYALIKKIDEEVEFCRYPLHLDPSDFLDDYFDEMMFVYLYKNLGDQSIAKILSEDYKENICEDTFVAYMTEYYDVNNVA